MKLAIIENITFSQDVLITNMLTKAPISKIKVPTIIVVINDFFLSTMLLKKIVDMSISKKNTQTNKIFTMVISSLNMQTKTYENQIVVLKR